MKVGWQPFSLYYILTLSNANHYDNRKGDEAKNQYKYLFNGIIDGYIINVRIQGKQDRIAKVLDKFYFKRHYYRLILSLSELMLDQE